MYYRFVKRQSTSPGWQAGTMLPADANKALASNLESLIAGMPRKYPRPELASRIGIGDKTLGFLKSGTGNPTLENITKVASYFKLQAWELLKPPSENLTGAIDSLASLATPRSRAALQTIQAAAEQGDLSEADLLLLQRIADRFMHK